MPSIRFSHRLVFDKHFFDDIKAKKFIDSKPHILTKLMYINDRSIGHKRNHNVMSKRIFDNIIKENKNLDDAILRSSFCGYNKIEVEKIDNEIERTIITILKMLGK